MRLITVLFVVTGIILVIAGMASSAFLPSTVTTSQWRDTYLAKWQAGDDTDKRDAVEQLAALLLVIPPSDPIHTALADRLEIHVDDTPDASMAIAFQALATGQSQKASRRLLDLILQYPDDYRINRFRIALARAFGADNQFDLAAAQLEPLMNTSTTNGQWAMLEKGLLLHEAGQYEDAISLLTELAATLDNTEYLLFPVKQALSAAVSSRMLVEGVAIE
jgi:predicted Zn-dependent protease